MSEFIYPSGYQCFAGVDEVGRGPLVGDVVTAAVILDPAQPIIGLNDSKKLSEKKRDFLYKELRGIEYNGIDRSMDLRICKLRAKIGDDPENPEIIKTVRGQGYLFMHLNA